MHWMVFVQIARKLLEPLSTIIQNTGAKSLQYECIHTVTLALPFTKREDGSDSKNAPAVVKLCSDYLRVREFSRTSHSKLLQEYYSQTIFFLDNSHIAVMIEVTFYSTLSSAAQGFIEDADQNLKYLGLVGLVNLMKVRYSIT